MVNKEIARQFNLLANLMELHGENAFKTKAYAGAYLVLRKWDKPIDGMDKSEIDAIAGIGSSVASKIHELVTTGKMEALEKYREKTPEGIQQMLSIKGLGPKKVKQIWDELKVESPAELLYACNENRLVKLSGFGLKTQEDIRQKIEYFLESAHQFLYGTSEEELNAYLVTFQKAHPKHQIEWVGEFERKSPILNKLELLISPVIDDAAIAKTPGTLLLDSPGNEKQIEILERFKITLHFAAQDQFHQKWSELTMSSPLFQKISNTKSYKTNSAVAEQLRESNLAELPSELMDKEGVESLSPSYWNDLVTQDDLKGIIHNHSTWSDGINSLEEMAVFVRDQGYQYFVICDHSRSAFYANGLNAERVFEQFEEIDALNKKLAPFKIYKGIESDILNDGSLDYDDEVLSKFELIVASVHSNLRMDQAKAMNRPLPYPRNAICLLL